MSDAGGVTGLKILHFKKYRQYFFLGESQSEVFEEVNFSAKYLLCIPSHKVIVSSKSSPAKLGGLGGFGLELADWLVLLGARKIVLTSRSGVTSGYQSSRVRTWRSYGVSVQIATDDITTEDGVNSLLNAANQLGPVAAIFNLAVVLVDAIFKNQTPEQFVTSFGPKATATQHLDQLSRRLCPQLEHFVVFSSVSCGRGNAGQTNYGMANSVMERICERRVEEGYPGLAVQWGAVGDVGLVADKMEDHKEVVIGGTLQQGISSCLQVLDGFLCQKHPVVSSMVVAEKKLGGTGNLVEYVAGMLGIRDIKMVSENATLADLGIDSLMVVEVKQTFEQQYDLILSPREIRALTFKALAEMANNGSGRSQEKNFEWNVDAFHFLVKAFSDESAASKEVLDLPSMTCEVHHPTLFMIPGIEGMAAIFESLAKKISLNVKGLQLVNTGESFSGTVGGIAQKLLQNLKKRLAPNEPFKILGHSFGGVVALQLALLLEEEGHQGHIYLLDSSPEFVQTITKFQMNNSWNYEITNEDNLQINTVLIMLDYLKNKDSPSVRDQTRLDLTKMSTWGERVELFLSLLPDNANHSRSYSTSVVNALWSRMKAISSIPTTVSSKIKSSVTLFRPHYKGLKIEKDYGLSMYCEKPVCVHLVDGDHVSIVESAEVASVINREATTKKIGLDAHKIHREQKA